MPRNSSAIIRPNRGLWLNTPLITVPDGALSDGHNFRIKNGTLNNINLGWSRFDDWTLNGPVTLIDGFFDRISTQILIFGTPTDLYQYDAGNNLVLFLTPIEVAGTVDVSADNPAVVTEDSGTSDWATIGIKAGDMISFGADDENDPDATWYEIASVDDEDTLTLTTTVAGAPLSASTFTIRRLFTGDLDHPWESVTFLHEGVADEDLWIATNGLDDIVSWNGMDATVISAGLGFKAFHLATFKNMLMASGITESGEFLPAQVRNSNPGFPLDFTTGLAGAYTIHDGSDEVSALLDLGDSLVAYSERHINVMDFVGDPFIFVIRTAVPNIGPISGRLVGEYGDTHTFLGPDAQYDFDGVTVKPKGLQVWREVLRRRDPQRTQRSYLHFDEENGDLIWAVPLTSDVDTESGPEIAYVEHYLEETPGNITPISKRAFPFTVTGFFERQTTLTWADIQDQWQELNFRWNDIFFLAAFPFNLAGDKDGKVYTVNVSQLADGELLPSYVRTGRRALGDTRMRGLMRRIYPFATRFAGNTLAVRTRIADSAAGPVTVADEQTFSLDMDPEQYFVSPFRAGRFYALEFASTGTTWELAGWDVDILAGGKR